MLKIKSINLFSYFRTVAPLWPHLQLNYMFLKECVEGSPVVPIQQQWLDAMLTRIPPQLRVGPGRDELLQDLCREVSENFLSGMVKHTGVCIHVYLCVFTLETFFFEVSLHNYIIIPNTDIFF